MLETMNKKEKLTTGAPVLVPSASGGRYNVRRPRGQALNIRQHKRPGEGKRRAVRRAQEDMHGQQAVVRSHRSSRRIQSQHLLSDGVVGIGTI